MTSTQERKRLLMEIMKEAVEEMIKDKLKKVLELKKEDEHLLGDVLEAIEYEVLEKLLEESLDNEEKWELYFYLGFSKHLLEKEL